MLFVVEIEFELFLVCFGDMNWGVLSSWFVCVIVLLRFNCLVILKLVIKGCC